SAVFRLSAHTICLSTLVLETHVSSLPFHLMLCAVWFENSKGIKPQELWQQPSREPGVSRQRGGPQA
uniref:Uncharacterized protein n=1 Tax=Aegilops tauschii subsp. strangulata TaxID=200361 RepID=A0A453JX03_AEGTS